MKILHSLKPNPNSPSWSHMRAHAEEENQLTIKRTLLVYHIIQMERKYNTLLSYKWK